MAGESKFTQNIWKHKWMLPVVLSFTLVYHLACVKTAFRARDWELKENYSHGSHDDEMEKYIKAQEKQ
ncbi:hypothetical protein ACHWQZ_G015506 [Mnemiopsis leidyi]